MRNAINRPTLRVGNAVFGKRMLLADRILSEHVEDLLPDLQRSMQYKPDVFEWRVDYLDVYTSPDTSVICQGARLLAERAGEIPILFTPRHLEERGHQALEASAKFALIEDVLATGSMSLFDIEKRYGEQELRYRADQIHSGGAKLILSHHDFETPHTARESLDVLLELQEWEADIVKLISIIQNVHEFVHFVDLVQDARAAGRLKVPVICGQTCDIGPVMRVFGEALANDMTFVDSYETDFPKHLHIEDMRAIRRLVLGDLEDE